MVGSYAYQGSKPEAYITIDYYDTGTGSLGLQYDASGSAYTSGGSVALTGTNTWLQHTFHVTDAYFGNRQNGGADFRITGPGSGNTFYIDLVQVSESPPGQTVALTLPFTTTSLNEGKLLEFTVSATDENNGSLTFTHPLPEELPQGASFSVTVDEPGHIEAVFSWTPTYAQGSGTPYIVDFTVEDGNGGSDSGAVEITVNNVLVFGVIHQEIAEQTVPLEGAAVEVLDITRTEILASATTDGQGKFAVVGTIPDGVYIVRASKEAYGTYSGCTTLRSTYALPFSVTLYPPQMETAAV